MTPKEELDLLLKLIRKYDLPLSPILEYAVNEKIEENLDAVPQEDSNQETSSSVDVSSQQGKSSFVEISDFNIPDNADTTTQNKYLMQFCYGILQDFKGALDEREKNICNLLLVENSRRRAAEEYKITEERVRQIYVRSIKRINHAHTASMQELDVLRKANEELKRRNYILENELANSESSAKLENVLTLQELEDQLCNNAKRLLAHPLDLLPFSNRTLNVLRTARIEYFKEIPQLSLEEIQKMRNCGRKTITELRAVLSNFSLDLGLKYEEIVSRLIRYKDQDFNPEFFEYENPRNKSINKGSKRSYYSQQIETEQIVEFSTPADVDVEECDESQGSIEEEISTLPICKENRNGFRWTTDEENEIADFFNQGHSVYSIAKATGRTKYAIELRLDKLGLSNFHNQDDNQGNENNDNTYGVEVVGDNPLSNLDGIELADRFCYPIQDFLFCDKNNQVYEIYLTDNDELVVNHLVFDLAQLREIEDLPNATQEEKEKLFSNYWYDNHINVIARFKPESKGYDVISGSGQINIQEIHYQAGKYSCVECMIFGEKSFVDYYGQEYDSPDMIMSNEIIEVAKYHDFFNTPKYITKEYIRLGMIEIKRISKGIVKRVSIYTDSELGQSLKNETEEIWQINGNCIIAKNIDDASVEQKFHLYCRNGVRWDSFEEGVIDDVKAKSIILQNLLDERIKKLLSRLTKKNDIIRYERQFKEIMSSLFVFNDNSKNEN